MKSHRDRCQGPDGSPLTIADLPLEEPPFASRAEPDELEEEIVVAAFELADTCAVALQ
jgi:hypothetical protein